MNQKTSIVIPAFNEEDRVGASISTILAYINANGINAELIVVDDGSSDRTSETAEAACSKFPEIPSRVIRYEPNRGKGFAVKTGILAAEGEIALFSDADLSTPIEEMPKLVDPIKAGDLDVTLGSRALDRSLIGTHQPWRREQGGKVFNLVVRLMTGMPFWDTQCGFKAFNVAKFRPLLDMMQIERFGFDVEFLYVAQLHGLRLKEIPVRWNNDDRSKVNVLRDSIRMFDEVRQIRRNARKGVYGNVSTP
ncbi:MAG: glycosyltransferase family 2 protein [Blastocatellia bacterium]|nr:glycosyltransferase family 2 protein [Chloracidobacterium sp.]MBL8183815.1 glycosyltransferase family 2 protein [Blastocatellia bacterium]HRJ89916.1 glycosyltransferase family 2 protein [Pyrinomonadaceae bacterium]HRK51500.1 glycosyltransferase family 2 protein [Pyrinomonadaceae bacterium]